MRQETISLKVGVVQFVTETCCACGVLFAMTAELQEHRLADKASFYCPNGHGQSYVGKTDAQLRKEAVEARRIAEATLAAERDQRIASERELKRHQQRAKGGACPVCKRTFVQVARHMKSQHPSFAASSGEGNKNG